MLMVRKKMTTYIDEDLLRSAKVLAAHRDSKIYEVFEDALRHYLKEANTNMADVSLAEALSGQRALHQPGVPPGKAVRLTEGETLSEAVIDERENQAH